MSLLLGLKISNLFRWTDFYLKLGDSRYLCLKFKYEIFIKICLGDSISCEFTNERRDGLTERQISKHT